jgi:hypothetical protein
MIWKARSLFDVFFISAGHSLSWLKITIVYYRMTLSLIQTIFAPGNLLCAFHTVFPSQPRTNNIFASMQRSFPPLISSKNQAKRGSLW